jgi:hypothetical protein
MAASKIPADKPSGVPARPGAVTPADDLDDNGDPWRHPPVAPKDEGPLESFARSVSETVTGPLAGKAGKAEKPKP